MWSENPVTVFVSCRNCLFRALGDQLEGHSRGHLRLRQETVQYMMSHRQDFEPFVEDDVPFAQHCKKITQWGTIKCCDLKGDFYLCIINNELFWHITVHGKTHLTSNNAVTPGGPQFSLQWQMLSVCKINLKQQNSAAHNNVLFSDFPRMLAFYMWTAG